MTEDNIAAYAIFNTRAHAERCVNALLEDGFRQDDVSILAQEQSSSRDLATEKNTKAPEGAATGATTGGVIGGTLGLLAGVGVLTVPGVGPFLAAGPIMATLAGFGAGAAAGGLAGSLAGVGIPEYEAKRYEGHINNGGILLSVHCANSDLALNAKAIMEENGGQDIASADEGSAEHPAIPRTGTL